MDKLARKLMTFGRRNKACMALALFCVFFLYAFAVILDNVELAYKALRGNAGRRIAAAALAFCMVFTLLPAAAFATEGGSVTLGASGVTNVTPGASGVVPLITGFAPLDAAIRTQRVGADDLVLPETLLATVDGEETEIAVTWDGLDAVNEARKSGGLFVLTANVGEGYRLAEGVTAPTISAIIPGMGRILGAGTAANPLQLRTEEQLREIAVLTNAGALSETVFGAGSTDKVYIKLMNDLDISGSQWTPIGMVAVGDDGSPDFTKTFSGVFDGGGNTIKGLTIDAEDAMLVGLFGATATGSQVKNLNLTDVSVSGGIIGAGGVVGYADGNIKNCSVSGSVTSSGNGVGGVAAAAIGDISRCYVSGSVTGSGESVGGVAGLSIGNLDACAFSGRVTGGDSVGGIAGGSSAKVSNCYVIGTVTGSHSVGGIVGSPTGLEISSSGRSYSGDYIDGLVSNCFATGTVNSSDAGGGIVGSVYMADIKNCVAPNSLVAGDSTRDATHRVIGEKLWSGEDNPFENNIAFAGMTVNGATITNGTATDENGLGIVDLATLDGKFVNIDIWNTFDGTTLPTLVGVGPQTLARPAHLNSGNPFAGGTGTQDDPYQIATAEQLRELGRLVNSGDATYNAATVYYKLTADLDISGSQWTPIGNSTKKICRKLRRRRQNHHRAYHQPAHHGPCGLIRVCHRHHPKPWGDKCRCNR